VKKTFFLFIFIGVISGFIKAQERKRFSLVVKFDSTDGPVIGIGEAYYFELLAYKAATIDNDTAICKNGRYEFSGDLIYPTAIRIYTLRGSTKFSELFFIDSGYQEIALINVLGGIKVQKRPSTIAEQEYQAMLKYFGTHDINGFISPSSLLSFVKKYPSSYIGLFTLLDQTFAHDFKFLYKEVASSFSSNIKSTEAFKYYSGEYLIAKHLPTVKLKTCEGKNINFSFKRADGKYTLIEFWYAGCKPCVSAMYILKKEFSGLSSHIRIIGISTDNKSRVADGKALLKLVNPPWKNYWDYEAEEFTKHTNIYVYPSNVLIDNKGRMVAKNIEIAELKKLLQTIN